MIDILEMDTIDLIGVGCLATGISWLLSLLLCWWKGDFDYLTSRIKGLYRLCEKGY